jgi:hypothetical protein
MGAAIAAAEIALYIGASLHAQESGQSAIGRRSWTGQGDRFIVH